MKKELVMSILVHIVLPEEHADFAERILRTAASILETQGTVSDRTDLGSFTRTMPKGRAIERLVLASFANGKDEAIEPLRARALEAALRSTVAASGVEGVEVRVFVGGV